MNKYSVLVEIIFNDVCRCVDNFFVLYTGLRYFLEFFQAKNTLQKISHNESDCIKKMTIDTLIVNIIFVLSHGQRLNWTFKDWYIVIFNDEFNF
ncbi:hypothetical protein BpHYR1_022109 [Brachionus plicatilis]|uniref:Uncharacterized protein n=1 Tax=Brachionus plicatilis TaxID=10195 RepID=A0A3M7SQT6_BRAPC|nr:hypothetical protein BpHYR1_022109 [Brachionus plicatilis]